MKENRKYSKEFKLDAISLVREQGYTRVEAARSLGIDRQLIGRWLKEEEKTGEESFRGQGKLSPEQLEIRRLKEEVKRLKMETSLLKSRNKISIY